MFIYFLSGLLHKQLATLGWKVAPNKDNPDAITYVKKGLTADLEVDFETSLNNSNKDLTAFMFEKYFTDSQARSANSYTGEEALLLEYLDMFGSKKGSF